MINSGAAGDLKTGANVIPLIDRALEEGADLHHDVPQQTKADGGDHDLKAMNDEYAVVQLGGRTRVFFFEESSVHAGCKEPVFQRKDDFVSFHLKHKKTFVDANGKRKETGMGTWWFSHPERRQYKNVVFAPGAVTADSVLNLWTGFSCESLQGDCSLFLQHLRENICGGVDEYYEYLLNWMAIGVQRPGRQGEVAIVMRGREGTGKGIFAKTYGGLFGPHFLPVSNAKHLVGNFNAHLLRCSVLFADEAFFAGDRSYEPILKAVVTEDTLMIEPKGVDPFTAPNRLHLILASNADWVIPAGAEARRFFMLDVSDAHMQDRVYFRAIDEQLRSGGREALLHFLEHRDLSKFDVAIVPQTAALAEQKAFSRRDIDRLVETIAHDGLLPSVHEVLSHVAITTGEKNGSGFYVEARSLVPELKYISSPTIKAQLKKYWRCADWTSNGKHGISFPPLADLRVLFDKKHGVQEWPPSESLDWRGS